METNHCVQPRFIAPMLCTPAPVLPHRQSWFYEVKRDGRRALAVKDRAKVTLYSSNGDRLDCPPAADAVRKLNAVRAVVDCEIIALTQKVTLAPAPRSKPGEAAVHLYAFDLLHLNGRDLTREPIEYRKDRLCTLTLDTLLLFSPSLDCEPDMLLEQVAQLGLPGIIAKRRGSAYQPGKNDGSWVTRRVKHCEPLRRLSSAERLVLPRLSKDGSAGCIPQRREASFGKAAASGDLDSAQVYGRFT
jgi:bifunctional non-homologous end joining protein LigD